MWGVGLWAMAMALAGITVRASVSGQSSSEDEAPESGTFRNPIFDRDFPDPDVLKVGDTYYAYATNADGINLQVARSLDLVHWKYLGEGLSERPAWAVAAFGFIWAPEVVTFDGETFVLYYVARFDDGKGGRQCIGVATSDRPEGPFTPVGDGPLVCQLEQGGSIDPYVFFDDDGQPYLLWKNDGNAINVKTWIYIQPLSADGLTLDGELAQLLSTDRPWEGTLIEAPTLWRHHDTYVLFYSANAYYDGRYAIGYATSDNLFGPYTKPERPMLETNEATGIIGPGGQDIVTDAEGTDWLVFHGWLPGEYRRLYLAPLEWADGVPAVTAPLAEPLPLPTLQG